MGLEKCTGEFSLVSRLKSCRSTSLNSRQMMCSGTAMKQDLKIHFQAFT